MIGTPRTSRTAIVSGLLTVFAIGLFATASAAKEMQAFYIRHHVYRRKLAPIAFGNSPEDGNHCKGRTVFGFDDPLFLGNVNGLSNVGSDRWAIVDANVPNVGGYYYVIHVKT